jgi:hypothetical protein
MPKITESDVAQFWAVREWLKLLVATSSDQTDLANTKAILVDMKNVLNDSIGTFDRNVDAFRTNAANGMYGKNFKLEISRIHQPRGRKAGEAVEVDEKTALFAGLKLD